MANSHTHSRSFVQSHYHNVLHTYSIISLIAGRCAVTTLNIRGATPTISVSCIVTSLSLVPTTLFTTLRQTVTKTVTTRVPVTVVRTSFVTNAQTVTNCPTASLTKIPQATPNPTTSTVSRRPRCSKAIYLPLAIIIFLLVVALIVVITGCLMAKKW